MASLRHLLLASTFGVLLALPLAAALLPTLDIEMPVSRGSHPVTEPSATADTAAEPHPAVGLAGRPPGEPRPRLLTWPTSIRAGWATGAMVLLVSLALALRRLARIRASGEAERACDDAVIEGTECTDYAEQLVSLARGLGSAAGQPVPTMVSRSDLAVRVSALLDGGQRRGRAGRLSSAAAVIAASLLVLAIAPIRAVRAAGSNVALARLPPGDALLDRALLEAAERGDVGGIKKWLDAGADVNAALEGDGSPLIAAAREGRLAAVRLLLDRGADPDLPLPGDGSPIIMAAREGHLYVVELLLERGANVDLMVPEDENALIQASGAGRLEVMKLLVSRGADVNARAWVGPALERPGGEWRTPLSMAGKGGHDAVVAFLRSAGARD